LLLGRSSNFGHVGKANNDDKKGRSGKDMHDDDASREIVRGDE
jgi:hypothetical protein